MCIFSITAGTWHQQLLSAEISMIQQVKEKYQLTPFLKVYGGYAPDRDGELVSIKIKAPSPMLVAMVRRQLRTSCTRSPGDVGAGAGEEFLPAAWRAVANVSVHFNAADGPQSLIVCRRPARKSLTRRRRLSLFASKCVANWPTAPNPSSSAESQPVNTPSYSEHLPPGLASGPPGGSIYWPS